MSKKHYNNYSNISKQTSVDESVEEIEVVEEPVEEITEEIEVVEEIIEDVVTDTPVEETIESTLGVVRNCTRLNVRKSPDKTASVLCVLDVNSVLEVNLTESTGVWYKVYTTDGVEGYCMKDFVVLK